MPVVEVMAKWDQGFGPLLIKDTTHHLERMLAQASGETVEISWEQARMKIEGAIDSHIYLNRANARGDVWYVLGKDKERVRSAQKEKPITSPCHRMSLFFAI